MNPLVDLQLLLHAETDRLLEPVFAQAEAQAGRPYACRAGCSACCHQVVLCTAPEAMLIGHHLHATRSEGALAAMVASLEAQSTAAAGLTFLGYSQARIPCAFLDENGACSIYEVRPMACRALKSFSALACERSPESWSDLGSHRIPGSGPGLRAAKMVGVEHYRTLARDHAIDPQDFTLSLFRAVAIAVAAEREHIQPDFGPARLAADGPV
jgi:Fe-S-cluster containining protein